MYRHRLTYHDVRCSVYVATRKHQGEDNGIIILPEEMHFGILLL